MKNSAKLILLITFCILFSLNRICYAIPKELQSLPYAIYPDSSTYNIERFDFNKRFDIHPKAIFIPDSNAALIKTIKILHKNKLNFSIRSGGHCFEASSLSPDYIVDLRNFNSIKFLKNGVYVGTGVRSSFIIEALGERNLAIPTGTCASVGIGGLALGGGIGWLSRTYGLTSDAIKSITLLTADAKIIEVNPETAPDLFWALRGAGQQSYGIVLGFTFKPVDIPEASFIKLSWEWDPALASEIIHSWHQWIQGLPENINPVLTFIYSHHHLSISITGLKVGHSPFREWESAFKKLHPHIEVKTGNYLQLTKVWEEHPNTPFLKIKSNMTFKVPPAPAIEYLIHYLEKLQRQQADFNFVIEITALGGEFARGNSAFFPRKAFEWWHEVASWENPSQTPYALHSIRQFNAKLTSWVGIFCYSNDVDYDLGKNYLTAYYGNHINRLIKIKNKYDPYNFFHWKQSIPVSSPDYTKSLLNKPNIP